MTPCVTVTSCRIDEADALNRPQAAEGLWLRWLGQAGFLIGSGRQRIVIDPYLSDYLAKKYAGKEFAHQRMMSPPMAVEELTEITALLCTHRHSDHMDPETVPDILQRNRQCRLVAPRADKEHVLFTLNIPQPRVVFVDAEQTVSLGDGITVEAIAAAHEDVKTDNEGRHCYLGYILRMNRLTVYHSGDCIPYPGLAETLKEKHVDIALLPVNGRDDYRKSRAVPGNFSFDEAVSVSRAAGINMLMCHHFGMFAFNTVEPHVLADGVRAASAAALEIIVPQSNRVYRFERRNKQQEQSLFIQ